MKIISFALWGEDDMYLRGAVENARLAEELYPDWKCRFYIDDKVPARIIDSLNLYSVQIVIKGQHSRWNGLYWRMQPIFEHTPRVIIRDCDSRLTMRDAVATQEWEASGLPFHIMRDHPNHKKTIMGGMWGIVPKEFPQFEGLVHKWLNKHKPVFGSDQKFLKSHIWPIVKNKSLAHDDMKRWSKADKPFTIERKKPTHFVGQKYTAEGKPVYAAT